MRDLWDAAAAPPDDDPLAQCVYGSRLLGSEPGLVVHGGGNTSVKMTATDITGDPVELLYVKGSGWDLATIEAGGFTAVRLDRLRALARLARLPDTDMMNELRCARIDAAAPDPSVESLLHALIPDPVVLHSHADAILALTNQPPEAGLIEKVFGDEVLVVPYTMPGFDLARVCADLFRQIGPATAGIVLMHHGLVTFAADVEEAYRRHIDLVTRAERYLAGSARPSGSRTVPRPPADPLELARLRRAVSDAAGAPMVLARHDDAHIRAFVDRPDLASVAGRGPSTPDHVLRTKRLPLIGTDVAGYAEEYRRYFDEHQHRRGASLSMVDPAPRVLLDPALGMLTAGRRATDARVAHDIYRHTIDIIEMAESVGSYQALPAADIFDVEYWDLEQAKLRRGRPDAAFTGEVALVTGAASGIGRACAEALRKQGAAVVGLDLSPGADDSDTYLGLQVDVTDPDAVDAAIGRAAERFGGIDVVVAAAGIFPSSRVLSNLDMAAWRRTMAVNVDSIAHLFSRIHPFLALAPRGGRVVVVASRNAPAPGPGAAAYSASKAAAVQLARVAALEWAADGIRVNVMHPDAVFDTGLWTADLLAERARRYGLTVEQYKRRNLLHTEITSAQVGELAATMCSTTFAATTGAQIPIDGGNERVI
jgi:rhamnose utilization protein RhaD (predicted bifunctional aldolase and dehydrogenase)/NAD(P)-dependent dehydrogenase (short-subunit alcohol dehydrogenase family)